MPDFYPLLGPLLRALPPEAAHRVTIKALRLGLAGRQRRSDPPLLAQHLWGRDFPNPVGIAAGFDKDAEAPAPLLRLGFGFVEVGTVTPLPQPGNPRPRLFRLEEDGAVINRMGFNSGGLGVVVERMRPRDRALGVVGINIGKNRDAADAGADYLEGVRRCAPLADYLVVNVSSPNTPGLRDLQARAVLEALLRQLLEARAASGAWPPLLVKIAPDLTPEERADIAAVALATGIDGIVVANTTVARPPLRSPLAAEGGGLSGKPLFAPSTALLGEMYRLTQGRIPLIGVGGIASAADAYAKIRAGASLVQLYTALVFAGPALLHRIKTGLADLLRRDGYERIADAVGADYHREVEISIGSAPG